MVIRDICRKHDYPEDGFNEINDTVHTNLVNALTKFTQTQEAMEKRLNEMDKKFEERLKMDEQQSQANINENPPSGSRPSNGARYDSPR